MKCVWSWMTDHTHEALGLGAQTPLSLFSLDLIFQTGAFQVPIDSSQGIPGSFPSLQVPLVIDVDLLESQDWSSSLSVSMYPAACSGPVMVTSPALLPA